MYINLEFCLELTGSEAWRKAETPIRKLLICNRGDRLQNATLRISSTSDALVPFEAALPLLEADAVVDITQASQVRYNLQYLESLSHQLTTEMVLSVCCDGQPVYSWAKQFRVDKPDTSCDTGEM